MSPTRSPTIRGRLTRALFWRMTAGVGLLSLLVLLALHLLLARQQQAHLDRRVVKLTDIAVKAQRDGVPLAERLAEYAPRRPGTHLTVRSATGEVVYVDPDLPAHALSPDVQLRTFVPEGLANDASVPRFEIAVDVVEDTELTRAMAAMLAAITLLAAAASGWFAATSVRRNLAPIDGLGAQLARIEPADIGQRLTLSEPAGELEPWVERFNALLARLERAYRQLESFNADVAHELRTPLNNLIGQTEVALSRPRTAAQLEETLSSNLEELHRLGNLVRDMLFLSRADRGARARRDQPVSLAALAHEVAEFHEAAIDERGLRVRVEGDACVAADAGLLQRAVSNLLSNAVRHASPQTLIVVRVATQAEPSGGSIGDDIALTVSNRGASIAPEHLPRIFDRFFRADPSRHAIDSNHGLGLAIVAAIARMHGGRTFACSSEGETSIGLTLRAAELAATPDELSHDGRDELAAEAASRASVDRGSLAGLSITGPLH